MLEEHHRWESRRKVRSKADDGRAQRIKCRSCRRKGDEVARKGGQDESGECPVGGCECSSAQDGLCGHRQWGHGIEFVDVNVVENGGELDEGGYDEDIRRVRQQLTGENDVSRLQTI